MLARSAVSGGAVYQRQVGPGDILAAGEVIATLNGDVNSTITAAMIASGVINRTGMTAGRTDTTDTAENVLKALSGNDFDRNVLAGMSFRFEYRQSVAFATTWAHGRGWVAGVGTLDVAASNIKTFLCRILCAQKEVTTTVGTTNASAVVTLDNPQNAGTIVPGMLATGANIPAGAKVLGVTYGDTTNRINGDKITAVTLDQNATGTVASGTSCIFSPVIEINGVGTKAI